MVNDSNIAIIPARGGSKRIPNKNIKPFLNKPIIAYAIEAAKRSELFAEVMVSTDSEEIAEVALRYGAKIPFLRDSETANDYCSTLDVIIGVLEQYEEVNKNFNNACCLYPTAPFVTTDLLADTNNAFQKQNVDVLYTIQKFIFPIQRAFTIKDGLLNWYQPSSFLMRSQDLEPTYHDAGQLYWFRVNRLLKEKDLAKLSAGGHIIDEFSAHDIDYEEDWKMAEFKYCVKNNITVSRT